MEPTTQTPFGIEERLMAVQTELRAPKNRRNQFGGYNYRSAEDILEAAKPVCKAHGLLLNVSDMVEEVGGRIYVKAMAMVRTTDPNDQPVTALGWAREADSKKGMDDSQITGTASSYARKYALNGLFCIDDNQDADTMERARELAICAAATAENRADFETAYRNHIGIIRADPKTFRVYERLALLFPKTAPATTATPTAAAAKTPTEAPKTAETPTAPKTPEPAADTTPKKASALPPAAKKTTPRKAIEATKASLNKQ